MVRDKSKGGATGETRRNVGYVGSTGKSTGPQCHYEVRKGNQKTRSVLFLLHDLGPEQFNELLTRQGL
jgi:murein DD-endopeptidase MepM/ murein hydrolase activator NlpD